MASVAVHEETRRIDVLSRPKPIPPGFLEDRRSVYWVDYPPPKPQGASDGGSQVTLFTTTTRLDELALHRSVNSSFRYHRPSPIWPVRKPTLEATPTDRIKVLSLYKNVHSDFKMERSPYSVVTPGARSVSASERLTTLATHKDRQDKYGIYEFEWGQYTPVSEAAQKANITSRVETLAEAKPYHEDFKGEKTVQWPVSDQALKAIASLRLQQLARPHSRTMNRDDYDPYKVTTAARKSRATPRLEELCLPVPRKIRQKKAA